MSDAGIRGRLTSFLGDLTDEWRPIDETDYTPLYLLCAAGLVEVQFGARAHNGQTVLTFEAHACGVWLDDPYHSVVATEIRRAIPMWEESTITIHIDTLYQARLTHRGKECQQELLTGGMWDVLEHARSHSACGRVAVRLLNTETTTSPNANTNSVVGEVVAALRGIEHALRQASRQASPPEDRFIYLASPYSHPDAAVREERFKAACHATAELIRQGRVVFSPIVHSHPLALYGLPSDWGFWEQQDRRFLAACDELWVLKLDGWEQSQGVAAEVAMATAAGKPVHFMREVEEKDVKALTG